MSDSKYIHLVTGAYGSDHVASADDGSLYAAIVGSGQYVLNGLGYEVSGNNTFRLKAGNILMNGRHLKIDYGSSIDLNIENGSVGMNRIDLVVVTYRFSMSGESASVDVIQGTSTSGSPVVPSYTAGDILSGDTLVQMPLYSIRIEGINITTVTELFDKMTSMKSMYQMQIPPVGWIEYNDNGVNPSTRYPGTTWQLEGQGRFAICYDGGTYKKGATGGSATKALSSANIPSHNHDIGAHSHGMNHTHSVSAVSGTTNTDGAHEHASMYTKDAARGSAENRYNPNGEIQSNNPLTTKGGAHSHSFTVKAHNTNDSSKLSTDKNASFKSGNTGNGTAFDVMNPYIVLYRWKRTR